MTPKKSIATKIKAKLKNLSVDVFDHEKAVKQNITDYLSHKAKQYYIESNQIKIRIGLKQTVISAVYNQDQYLSQLPKAELLTLFLGAGAGVLISEGKVVLRVENYLSDYAATMGITANQLSIFIFKAEEHITIQAYHKNQCIENIALKDLIKHFTT